MKTFNLITCLALVLLFSFSVSGQMYFSNPSFEGPTGTGITPGPWTTCCYTPDTGPGPYGTVMAASNGSTWVGFWDGLPLLGSCTGGAGEGTTEQLPCALRAGKQYTFTLDIAWDLNAGATYSTGAILEVYGGMSACAKTSLLWSGAPTAANVWQTKTITFTPTSNWTYISFFAKSGAGNNYVLMDNLSSISRAATSVTSTNATCGGSGDDGTAKVTPPADGTAWQYSWSNGQTIQTATNLAPGTYTCTVTDPTEACPIPIYITVVITGPPTVSVTAGSCSGTTTQLQATVPATVMPSCIYTLNLFDSFGDGWTGPGKVTVKVSGATVAAYTLAGGSAGAYTFTVTQGNSIQLIYTAAGSYNNEQSYQLKDASNNTIYSSGSNPANNSGWSGTANCGYTPLTYTYSWSPAATLNNPTIANPVASPAVNTTYTVTITSSTNPSCPVTQSVIIPVCLPIELISFDAVKISDGVNLKWVTASEVNNDYFTVEKSRSLDLFEELIRIKGAGNSTNNIEYTIEDTNPYDGTSYYRIKQTDYDGKFSYSQIETVHFSNSEDLTFNIVPNPAHSEDITFNIRDTADESVVINIVDLTGKKVYFKNLQLLPGKTTSFSLNEQLTAGIYFVQIVGVNSVKTQKLIVE